MAAAVMKICVARKVLSTNVRGDRLKPVDDTETVKRMYQSFKARDIDGVLAVLAEDVSWANGMDGGYVQGHEGVREYWTRQWSLVDPRVEPVRFSQADVDSILVEVKQSIFNLDGTPLQDDDFGLQDKMVGHLFHFRNGLASRFDITDAG